MFLYTIFISPLEYFIENLFFYFYNVKSLDIVASLFFISLVVTLVSLPFYCRADTIRLEEEKKYSKIEPYINKIKRNFKGDERFFLLSTLYRQNNYNPIMAIRNSFSLLLQIPFFIAAYHFISNLELLKGHVYWIISDLSKPDMLLNIFNTNINILPIFMTIINIISTNIYLKSSSSKNRIKSYALALFFLFILYDSPSALVIYWTFNNIFYLLKNKYMDNNPRKFSYILFFLTIIVTIFGDYQTIVKIGDLQYGYLFNKIFPLIILFLVMKSIFYIKSKTIDFIKIESTKTVVCLFAFCCLGLILLQGFIIPLSLFNSDLASFVFEFDNFSFLSSIIKYTIYSFIGLYLFWGGIVLYLLKKEYRIYFIVIMLSFYFFSLFNYINFGKNLGSINTFLVFENNNIIQNQFDNYFAQIPNLLLFVIILFSVGLILKKIKIKYLIYPVLILVISEILFSGLYFYKFLNELNYINKTIQTNKKTSVLSNKIELTNKGKNVIIIILDRYVGCLLPLILEEKPELKNIYSGFVFYPNTVSYFSSTVLAYPPCVGGYEYTPYKLDKDPRNFSEKWLESSLMLLTLFKNNNFISTVVDPEGEFDSNVCFYQDENFTDIYNSRGLRHIKMAGEYGTKYQKEELNDFNSIDQMLKRLYVYSFLNISANMFKTVIYNNGKYLLNDNDGYYDDYDSVKILTSSYSSLFYLKNITQISSTNNTFSLIHNDLPHCRRYLQYPKYELLKKITNIGLNKYNMDDSGFKSYHTAMASTILVGQYLNYLRESGVYDNSRIIITADHGNRFLSSSKYSKFQILNVLPFNPLLMVKDFNQNFEIKVDKTFMTNADVPYIAVKDIIDNPKNPFTGKLLSTDEKLNAVDVYINMTFWNTSHFTSSKVILDKYPVFMRIKGGDIFDESNWKPLKYKYNANK